MLPIPTDQQEKYGKIPPEVMQQLEMHLGNLDQKLLAHDPNMKEHLRNSHRLLISYPETAHLLSDDEIHLLIKRQEEYANIQIIEEVTKKGAGRGKSKAVDAANDL